ncbi:MAG: exported protein of unknown function [Dehalococcoidia bacterium]|nr:exported protein of unknown function [Dehalococcoidia bacterium]
MNVRTSVILILVLALVAGYVFFVQIGETTEPKEEPPWFYSIDMDDINRIAVTRLGEEAVFILREDNRWYFERPEGMPVNMDRWGGVTLLLSGPKVTRLLLEEQPTDLAPYGLDFPPITIEVDLKNGEVLPILLGALTPDGVGVYAQIEGIPRIFTIVTSWGEIMARLISEPPYPLWYYSVDTSIVTDIELQREGQKVTLTKAEDGWRFADEEKTPVDEAQLPSIFASLRRPSFQKLVAYSPSDISKYGLDEPSLSLFLRTQDSQQANVNVINELLIKIGLPTDDGEGYYAQAFQAEGVPDVFQVDAAWVEALQAIAANPSYPHTAIQGSAG